MGDSHGSLGFQVRPTRKQKGDRLEPGFPVRPCGRHTKPRARGRCRVGLVGQGARPENPGAQRRPTWFHQTLTPWATGKKANHHPDLRTFSSTGITPGQGEQQTEGKEENARTGRSTVWTSNAQSYSGDGPGRRSTAAEETGTDGPRVHCSFPCSPHSSGGRTVASLPPGRSSGLWRLTSQITGQSYRSWAGKEWSSPIPVYCSSCLKNTQ